MGQFLAIPEFSVLRNIRFAASCTIPPPAALGRLYSFAEEQPTSTVDISKVDPKPTLADGRCRGGSLRSVT
jgi:hypothetical protein